MVKESKINRQKYVAYACMYVLVYFIIDKYCSNITLAKIQITEIRRYTLKCEHLTLGPKTK